MIELLGKSKEALRSFCAALGEPAYRGGQIYHALYAESKFDFARMTNLPLALRERLAKEARITLPEVKQRFSSGDGSVRYLFELSGAEEKRINTEDTEKNQGKSARTQPPAAVEAVFMPSEGRQTICISTQAGCAVDCHFCLTAQLGLIRNLAAGEIVAQVLVALEEQRNKGPAETGMKDAELLDKTVGTQKPRKHASAGRPGAGLDLGDRRLRRVHRADRDRRPDQGRHAAARDVRLRSVLRRLPGAELVVLPASRRVCEESMITFGRLGIGDPR